MKKSRQPYTKNEIQQLQKLATTNMTAQQIAEKMKRSRSSIAMKLSRLGVVRHERTDWTEKELSVLKKYYKLDFNKIIDFLPNRTRNAIVQKAFILGIIDPKQNWTDEELHFIEKQYPTTDNAKIATTLGKTVEAVENKAFVLRLKKKNHFWDKPWEDFIVNNWPVMSVHELVEDLERKFKVKKTYWSVVNKYRELTGKRNNK